MRKKALNVILFLAVVIAAVGMTLYVAAELPAYWFTTSAFWELW